MSEYKELIAEQKVMLIEAIQEAFPKQSEDRKAVRDYFAAAALQGLISAARGLDGIVNYSETVIAENAYALADAMLKAREND